MHKMVLICAVSVLALAACGKTSDHQSAANPTKAASAEKVAKEKRGKVRCPASVSTQRPAGAPVDDVVGVRPGQTWDEASNVVLCDNPLLVIEPNNDQSFPLETHGVTLRQGFDAVFARARAAAKTVDGKNPLALEMAARERVAELQGQSAREMAGAAEDTMKPGDIRYHVGAIGLPNQERVTVVSRQEMFAQGKEPAMETLKQALVQKYGEPSRVDTSMSNWLGLQWEYDPSGRKITETSPLYGTCRISDSFAAAQSVRPDCGVTVAVQLRGRDDNPALVASMIATSLNSAATFKGVTDTQAALNGQDAARQSQELDRATKSAPAPKL